MRHAWCLAVLPLLLIGASAVAQAPPVEQQLEAVRELTLHARFGEAITAAQALLGREDLTAAQRNAGLEALAVAQLANRQTEDAEQTLRRLYARDPQHRLTDPDASPPVIGAFARAREAQPEQVPVILEHEPPTLERREAPVVTVAVREGEGAVAEVRLIYRAAGEGESRVVMGSRPDGTYTARIPVLGEASTATDVAYRIVALAPSLAPLAAVGSEAEPLQVRIPAEARTAEAADGAGGSATEAGPGPAAGGDTGADAGGSGGSSVVEQWWFWTLLAAVVVGGAVTAGILLGPAQDGPEEGTLGSVRLMQVRF